MERFCGMKRLGERAVFLSTDTESWCVAVCSNNHFTPNVLWPHVMHRHFFYYLCTNL